MSNTAINQAFSPLIQIANNVRKLDPGYLLKQLFLDEEFKAFVLYENTQKQLYNKGIDSLGKKLRSDYAVFGNVYSNRTIFLKKEKGQPTDRVTLKDEGKFYDSFILELKGNSLYIDADTLKEDNDLMEVWGQDILGLTQDSLQEVINLAIEIVIPIVQQKIFE